MTAIGVHEKLCWLLRQQFQSKPALTRGTVFKVQFGLISDEGDRFVCGIDHVLQANDVRLEHTALRRWQDLVAEISAQVLAGAEIHLAIVQQVGEFSLDLSDSQKTRCVSIFEINQHVDVALTTEIVAQDRSKEGEPGNMIVTAELAQPDFVHFDFLRQSFH